MWYKCSSCGFEGLCCGTPLESRALTPFCPQCSKRNTLHRIVDQNDEKQCLDKGKKPIISFKRVCDMIESILVATAFLGAIIMLPPAIAEKDFFNIILCIVVFFFFWEHFFWHKIARLSYVLLQLKNKIRSIYGKN